MNRLRTTLTRHVLPPALFLLAFFLAWHLYVVWFDVKAFLVPPPSKVLDTLVQQLEQWRRQQLSLG